MRFPFNIAWQTRLVLGVFSRKSTPNHFQHVVFPHLYSRSMASSIEVKFEQYRVFMVTLNKKWPTNPWRNKFGIEIGSQTRRFFPLQNSGKKCKAGIIRIIFLPEAHRPTKPSAHDTKTRFTVKSQTKMKLPPPKDRGPVTARERVQEHRRRSNRKIKSKLLVQNRWPVPGRRSYVPKRLPACFFSPRYYTPCLPVP